MCDGVALGTLSLHFGDETCADGMAVIQFTQQSVDVERVERLPDEVGKGR